MKGFETPKSTPEEKLREGVTRRELLIGAGAAAAGTAWGMNIKDSLFKDPDAQYKVLQEKLSKARAELPPGSPIDLSIAEDGEIFYAHRESPRSTEFLNYITGRGELTEVYIAAALRKDMFNLLLLDGNDVTSKQIRDKLYGINTEAELINFYVEHFRVFKPDITKEWQDNPEGFARYRIGLAKEMQETALAAITPEFYDALWKVYIKAGAAPIEMVDTYEERPSHKNHFAGAASSFAVINGKPKINIDLTGGYKSLLSGFMAETAHVHSYTNDKEGYLARSQFQKEFLRSLEGLSDTEIFERRKAVYITPGTVEYHDHVIVLPQLFSPLIPFNPIVGEALKDEQEILESYKTQTKPQGS